MIKSKKMRESARGEAMKKLKLFLGWVLSVCAFCALVDVGTKADASAEAACQEKGMILIQGRGKSYCTTGTREGL
ncbi:hypothetical protein PP590_gp41 [Pseudoalteromonas phage HS1]|uniref:hypothetical protein n=1 Tax=Pseudoalteromonas phage HS5 TaxID=1357709 RepID=UPI002329897A|nr:hypothetical protein PP589_gp30 [Pseudoalteromonas phage HS5]YP_010660198.1 hypothetical protein PP590_gp41 [Pseudoalteromonas phage HS1]